MTVRVLGFILGVILLLPGACSLGFMFASSGGDFGTLMPLWLLCLAISFGGVLLIRSALRRKPAPRDPPT